MPREKYIDGIFNYCDRWCERCPFTERCRSFAMGEALERHMKRKDEQNARFWSAMQRVLGDEIDKLAKEVDALADPEPTPEVEDFEDKVFKEKMDRDDRAVRRHLLFRTADLYLRKVNRSFKAHPELLKERDDERTDDPVDDAVAIIGWYYIFIEVKFARALHGLVDQESMEEEWDDADGESYPKDSDGSAKIAILASERSIGAWSVLRDRLPAERDLAIDMMKLLLRIRKLGDQYFPDARTFHRPGFDDEIK